MKWICSVSGAARNSSKLRALAARARLAAFEVALERGEIADRRIQPHVEILARRIRNRNAEVGRIARDVPVPELTIALARQPLLRLVHDLRLQASRLVDPLIEESHALRVREPEEKMIRGLEYRRRAGERRVGVLEVRGRVHRAAHLAGIAVLILGAAFRALALDVAIRQEHALHRIEELLDRLRVDEPGCFSLR